MLHVDGEGTATVERHGCVYADDDMDPTETSEISIPSGDIDYRIRDNELTILTSDLQGTFAP